MIDNESRINTPDASSSDTKSGSSLSRRDFLYLLGLAAVAATGGGVILALGENEKAQQNPCLTEKDIPQAWPEGDLPLNGLDIVNNPDYWVGENGEKLSRKLSQVLYLEYAEIYPAFRQFVLDKGYDAGEWQAEKMHRAFDKLTMDLADRGKDVVLAKAKGFDNIQEDLNSRYYELASYAQMLIRLIAYKNKVGLEQFSDEMYKLIMGESIGLLGNTQPEKEINRREIKAFWNYDWPAFGKGLTVFSPVGLSFISPDGFELGYKPYIFNPDGYLSSEGTKPPVHYGKDRYTKRPNRVEIVNFDPEVEAAIREELRAAGIERGMNLLTIVYSDHLSAVTNTGPESSSSTLFYPSQETLTIGKYRFIEREILNNVIHEGYHVLSSRRTYLPTADRMKVRELEQEILDMADPLADLNKVFNPEGDDHGYIEDNEHSITRYYLENVVNMYDNMGLSAKDVLHEFRGVMTSLTGEDIFSTFWVHESDKDMDGVFARLERDQSKYTGVTKLIAQTLLDHREAILTRKRLYYYPPGWDGYYFPDVVMPLVFTYLVMYKPDEVAKSALPENRKEDRGLVSNLTTILHKRMRAFVRQGPSEEFLSELFSEAMLTRKYGEHAVGYVNGSKEKFENIVALLRKNKLAVTPNSSRSTM